MARSYDKNFVTIGQMVFKILRFSFFGAYFRRPSWILDRTEIRLVFGVSHDGMKLLWKFGNDRSNGLRYIEIWVFCRSFPAAILNFPPNRKYIVFFWFLIMPWSYGENFVTIGQMVFKILRFSFLAHISGGHLVFWSEPKLDWYLVCLMMVWSFCENLIMIGQTVSDILRFECFGAHFRPPSLVFPQTGSGLFLTVFSNGAKLR